MRAAIVAGLIFPLVAGCSNLGGAVRLGTLTAQHELVGRVLAVHSTFGAQVFGQVRRFSASIDEYCASNGDPDYVMIEQPGALMLFTLLYADRDRAVYFRGASAVSLTARFGSITEESPMPRWLWGRMSNTDQQLAEAHREATVDRPFYGHWRDAYDTPDSGYRNERRAPWRDATRLNPSIT